MNTEQRNAIGLPTLKYRRTGLGCYLMGQKDTMGALGTGASSFDSVNAEQSLTPLHNLLLGPLQRYEGRRRCAEGDQNFVPFVVYSYIHI